MRSSLMPSARRSWRAPPPGSRAAARRARPCRRAAASAAVPPRAAVESQRSLPAETVARVVIMTCTEPPGEATRWTGRAMARQAGISLSSAVRHMTSWSGVELGGGPAPATSENIAAAMELYPVGARFFQEFTLGQVLLNAAKNGCGPSAVGTSTRAEGRILPGLQRGRGSLFPSRTRSRRPPLPLPRARLDQPAGARGLGRAAGMPGPLRLAPGGHIIGIDMDAALTIGVARGADLPRSRNCCRPPRRVWSRRCVAIEFGMALLIRPRQCPLTACLPPYRRTWATFGSDPRRTSAPVKRVVRFYNGRGTAEPHTKEGKNALR